MFLKLVFLKKKNVYNASKAIKAATGNVMQKRVLKVFTKSLKNTYESVNFERICSKPPNLLQIYLLGSI